MRSLLVFSLALACLPQSDLRSEDTGLLAGAAVADISPTTETFQLRSGKSSVVHDPLHVRAVALQNGEGRCVIALVDAIGTGREETDEAKRIVAEKTGWPVESMLVSATHTHTAPKGGDTSPERIAYEKTRFEGIVAALEGAIASLRPAEIGFASDEEPSEVRNRRWFLKEGTMDPNPLGTFDQVRTNAPRQNLVKPAGPVDPEVAVIDIRDRKGKPLGFVANYALHYVGGLPKTKDERGREVGVASADYFGEFARIFPTASEVRIRLPISSPSSRMEPAETSTISSSRRRDLPEPPSSRSRSSPRRRPTPHGGPAARSRTTRRTRSSPRASAWSVSTTGSRPMTTCSAPSN